MVKRKQTTIEMYKKRSKIVNNVSYWTWSLFTLFQHTNKDCVDSYWLNWIKWNEHCEYDSIEVVRSMFIRNMWIVDSSM